MARYSKESRLSPERVLQKAAGFFGPGGLGLESRDAGPGSALFEGGGGFVSISTRPEGRRTSVELETREWDHQVQQFLGKI